MKLDLSNPKHAKAYLFIADIFLAEWKDEFTAQDLRNTLTTHRFTEDDEEKKEAPFTLAEAYEYENPQTVDWMITLNAESIIEFAEWYKSQPTP